MKIVTVTFKKSTGFIKHILCTESNPKNFKIGEKFIVLSDSNPVVRVVDSEKTASKLNNSILNENWIRRVVE